MALPLLEAASNQVMLPGDAVTIRLHDAPREWAHAIDHSLLHCDGLVGQLLCMKKVRRLASAHLASPHLILPHLALPCLTLPCLALPRLIRACLALPCLALS